MSGPLRVVVLGHTAELGGAELGLIRLLDALPQALQVRVMLFADGPLVRRLKLTGHEVEVVPLGSRVASMGRADRAHPWELVRMALDVLPFIWRLARRVRALDADVIHSNSMKAHLLAVPVAVLTRRPLVWWMHDRVATDYLPRHIVRLVRLTARWGPRVVLVNSLATAATLPGVRDLRVAYPGVDPADVVGPDVRRPTPDPPVVGMIGRLSATKGQLEFVRAAAQVVAVRPEVRFRIIGSAMFGQQGYEQLLRREIERLELAEVVELTGFAPEPVVELDRLTVCVHASGTPEPFGQVITEAMARGVPVVATRGGGVTEILESEDGESVGLLAEPGDPAGLARAILEVLDDPAGAAERATAARLRVAHRFTIAQTAEVVEGAWASCRRDDREDRTSAPAPSLAGMRIRDRSVQRLLAAPFEARHWRALLATMQVHTHPLEALRRYLTNGGEYPWRPGLRTPVGVVRPELRSYHDLLTVNEVFCRGDYGSGEGVRAVVDIGANVGLAALYFLTRSPDVHVWCCEPDPANLARLRETLADHRDRVTIIPKAVVPDDRSTVRFTPMGRYGHVDEHGELEVPAINVAELLRGVQAEVGPIDLVKIDTEGTEEDLVSSAPPDVPVRAFVYEDAHGRTRWLTPTT